MVLQGAAMAGHLLVLLAMGLHARYVLADARGLLPPRPAESAAKPGTKKTRRAADDRLGGGRFAARLAAAGLRRASAVAAAATARRPACRLPPVSGS